MRKCKKDFAIVFFVAFLIFTMAISVGAETYEPDGGVGSEYLFPATECDRTLVINCVDESGELIKTISLFTKKGVDDITTQALYGYDIIGFQSNHGLWETCKITWCSGTGLAKSCHIQIRYCFRTGQSKEVMTATVTVRKSEAIKFTVRHYVQIRQQDSGYTYYSLKESSTQTVDYYTYVSSNVKAYAGYNLKDGYASNISGNLSYEWMGQYKNIPYDNFEYDLENTDWSDDMGEYSSYDESKDGKLDHCYNREYFVDYYYNLQTYLIRFDANGGMDAPEAVKKYYGLYITIPDTVPTRDGYDFLGWGTYATDTSLNYVAGDQFTTDANTTLYAIWDQYDYEFSVSNLNVDIPDELFPNETIGINVRTDSWDLYDPQNDIPVSIYYDGSLLYTEFIDFAAYGTAYLDFDLNVGSITGAHTVEVRINWTGKEVEVNPNNNTVSTTLNVISDGYSFSVEAITSNGRYKEGLEVMTSFLVYNNSERMVLPSADATVEFAVFFYCSNQKIVLEKQIWEELVIPRGESNLVYFRWTVPDGLAGNTIYYECAINLDGRLKEGDLNDNMTTLSTVVATRNELQTENPTYEAQAPSGYSTVPAPGTQIGSASWTVWEYENMEFVQKTYGIKVLADVPKIVPGSTCESAYYSDGKWTMKSGYGITLKFDSVTIGSLSGCTMPSSDTYTGVQSIYATFPEFRYSSSEGCYRALEYADGAWRFIENEGAAGGERLHYIPVWFKNGRYIVAVTVTDVWTPVGVLTSIRTTNLIIIDGSIFDDYYVGG